MTDKFSNIAKIVAVVALYWVVSISLVFVNKMLLQWKTITADIWLFICWFQTLAGTTCVALFLGLFKSFSIKSKLLTHNKIQCLSSLFVIGLTFNMLMLKYIGVAFYQVARSMTLVFVAFFSSFILREVMSCRLILCCVVVIFGYLVGATEEGMAYNFSLKGTIYGITASVVIGLTSVVMKISQNLHVSSLELTFYYNLWSCVIFTMLMITTDQLSSLKNSLTTLPTMFWLWLIYSGLLSAGMGWSSTLQIQYTSPMTHHISISAKSVFQTVIAVIYFQDSKTLLWWSGTLLTILGTVAYMMVKLKQDSKITLHSEYVEPNSVNSQPRFSV